MIEYVSWTGMILVLAGLWFAGYQDAKTRMFGFILGTLSVFPWMYVGLVSEGAFALFLLQFGILAVNGRNAIKNFREWKKPVDIENDLA